jgi:hypothetical protein
MLFEFISLLIKDDDAFPEAVCSAAFTAVFVLVRSPSHTQR